MDDLPAEVEEAAKVCAGNHRKFESFAWHDAPDDDENWMITATSHRDSGLLAQSNEAVFERELKEYVGNDIILARHSHWGHGYLNAMEIRVFKEDGETITEGFKAWHELATALASYPVLDDSDHSQREYDAQHKVIENAAPWAGDHERPEDWVHKIWDHFWNHKQECTLFNYDDHPYISEEEVAKVMKEIGIRYDGDEEDGEE